MEILKEEEMAARLNFQRPLHPEPEKPLGLWCIPFEYGSNVKGTRISVSKAKEIASELRAAVAEAELQEMHHYFRMEKERGDNISKKSAEYQLEAAQLRGANEELQRQIRSLKRGRRR